VLAVEALDLYIELQKAPVRVFRVSANVWFLLQGRTAAPAAFNAASKQVRSYASDSKASPTEVSSILEQRIRGVKDEAGLAETGRVLSVGYVEHIHKSLK
jgi:hypothetical protein